MDRLEKLLSSFVSLDPRSMWRRYVVALSVILTVLVGGHVSSLSATHFLSSDAVVGQLISRQEALSQRILVTSLRLVGEHSELIVRAELETLIDEFETAHNQILDGAGDTAMKPENSDRLRAIYYDGINGEQSLNEKLKTFLGEARLIHTANLESDEFVKERIDILRELGFYSALEDATEAFQLDSADRKEKLRTIQYVIIIVGLLTLIGEACLIFWPAHLATRNSLARLEDKSRELQSSNERLTDSLFDAQLARREADQSNRAKTMFLANMSHELRTPLNAIIGFSSMIKSEIFGPVGSHRYQEYANDIERSGTHLLDLIGDLMSVSQVEVGAAQLEPKNVVVSELISDVESITKGWSMSQLREISFIIDDDVGEYFGDPLRMRQIVLNLLSNAIKFTEDHAIITVHARCAAGGALELVVEDNGRGFDLDQIPTLMQPFQRGDDALTRSREGTGLGLSLVGAFAKMHGGDVLIENREAGGGRVVVHLPAGAQDNERTSCAA